MLAYYGSSKKGTPHKLTFSIFGHQMIAPWIGIWRLGMFGSWSLSGRSRSTILHSHHQELTRPAMLSLLWWGGSFLKPWEPGQTFPSSSYFCDELESQRHKSYYPLWQLDIFLVYFSLPFAFCFSNSIISTYLFLSSLVLPYAPNWFLILLETFVLATVLFSFTISFWLLLKFVCYIYVFFIYHFLDFLNRRYQFCGHLRQTF